MLISATVSAGFSKKAVGTIGSKVLELTEVSDKGSILRTVPIVTAHTAVSRKVVQKSVKASATMPKGSLGNTQ